MVVVTISGAVLNFYLLLNRERARALRVKDKPELRMTDTFNGRCSFFFFFSSPTINAKPGSVWHVTLETRKKRATYFFSWLTLEARSLIFKASCPDNEREKNMAV